jgi:hypothetical protein
VPRFTTKASLMLQVGDPPWATSVVLAHETGRGRLITEEVRRWAR